MGSAGPGLFTTIGLFAVLLSAPAAADDGSSAGRPLFADHATLAVRIEAPLRTVMRQRDEEEWHDGTLHYSDEAGTSHQLDLKVRARGKYRRRTDVCGFAPLRLNFRKKQVENTVFAGQDKLKLVTHCHSTRTSYEQFLLKEYLAYRLFQSLTDNSFRVRLLHVAWTDTANPGGVSERYAFLIEDEDHMAERLGGSVADVRQTHTDNLVPAQASLVAVYQYLIANTDYSLLAGPADDTCCHNAVLVDQGGGRHLPVPYDFDFSGFVNAPYASPNPKLKIRSVRTRLYRGYCAFNDELPAALQLVSERRDSLLDLIATRQGLDAATRKRALRFVERFYDVVGSPSKVERQLVKRCG